MTFEEKDRFIKEELYHELRCLLGAVTVWRIFMNESRGFDVIVAEDSSFVHARSLFEFFASSSKNKNLLKASEFGAKKYRSDVYTKWKMALNRHVLHLNAQRLSPKNMKGESHLSEQVESFAREILRLWVQFETDPRTEQFHEAFEVARLHAIADAQNDAGERIEPIFQPAYEVAAK